MLLTLYVPTSDTCFFRRYDESFSCKGHVAASRQPIVHQISLLLKVILHIFHDSALLFKNPNYLQVFSRNVQTIQLYRSYAAVAISTSADICKILKETSQNSWEVKSRSLTSRFANISPKILPHVPAASVGAFQNRLPAPLALPHTPQKAYRSSCCNVQLTLTGESTAKPTKTA